MRRGFLLDSTVRKTKENSASSPSAAKKPQSRPLLPIPTGPVIPSEIFPSPNLVFEELRRNYPNSQLGWVMSILPDIPPPTCEPWTTCLFLPGVKEALLSRPTFPSPFRSPPTRFCISAAPGAGLGMFATIDIQPGGLIAYERPLLIFPLALPYAGKGKGAHPEEVLRRVVYGQMPSAARTAFLQLKNSQTSDPAYIKGICDTNTIGISSMPGCKLRHGVVCCPNSYGRWDLDSFTYQMRALKPIRAGEQITMSYIGGPLVSRAERQEELQGKYAFTCACPACSSSLDEIQRSDGRRSILGTLKSDVDHDPAIRKWVADVSLQDDMFLAPYLRLMGYFEAETYADADAWPGVLQRLVKVYCALGNAEEARKVARKAACLTMVFTGDDGGWTKVADAPEKTTWWGLRAKAKEAARCANH